MLVMILIERVGSKIEGLGERETELCLGFYSAFVYFSPFLYILVLLIVIGAIVYVVLESNLPAFLR